MICIFRKILKVKEELETTAYFKNSIKLLDQSLEELGNTHIAEIICLGLGNFSDCPIALHQLAFLIGINEKYHHQNKPVKVYDPIFTSCEKSILIKLRLELLSENFEGKHSANELTLFYFPHCLKELSNNLLWKNWSPEKLTNVILISNGFKSIVDLNPSRTLRESANYLLIIQQFVEEKTLKNIYRFDKVFNDLSIHIFPKHIFENISADLWEQNQEPVYGDFGEELIKQD